LMVAKLLIMATKNTARIFSIWHAEENSASTTTNDAL
jgi:hypothetical protein